MVTNHAISWGSLPAELLTVPILPLICSAEQPLQCFTAFQVLGPLGNSREDVGPSLLTLDW